MLLSHLEKGINSKVAKFDDDAELPRVVKLKMDFKEITEGFYDGDEAEEIQGWQIECYAFRRK